MTPEQELMQVKAILKGRRTALAVLNRAVEYMYVNGLERDITSLTVRNMIEVLHFLWLYGPMEYSLGDAEVSTRTHSSRLAESRKATTGGRS